MRKTVYVIFFIVLVIRLFFAFQVETFSDDESYFALRQVEAISETGLPLIDDKLSYGGREQIFSPLFYYLLAFFNLIIPLEIVGKIIPNLLANLVIPLSFLISLEVTKNQKVAIFTAATSGFIPILFTETINTITPYTLVIPLMLASIYCFLKIETLSKPFIFFITCLAFTHISSYITVLAFLMYLLIVRVERIKDSIAEVELILFSVVLVVWAQFLIFKKAFILYGPAVLLQNIPTQVILDYFREISFIEVLNSIGIIPFLLGMYVIYKYSFKEKNRKIYLLLSFTIIIAIILWTRLVPIGIGLIFLGVFLSLLFSQYLKLMLLFIQKSKFSRYETLAIAALAVLFILTSIIPAFYFANQKIQTSFSMYDIEALTWIGERTPQDAVILASYREGSLINYHARRANVADESFLTIENINTRFEDIREIFTTNFETRAIELMSLYDVDYIYISDRTRQLYGIDNPAYTTDEGCFRLVFENKEVQVYRTLCRLERR